MTTSGASYRVLTAGLFCALVTACAHSSADQAAGPAAPAPGDGATVTAEDIQRTPSEPIEKILMARFPGVWVARTPEGTLAVRIRGATSINASTEPLYVIDGIPTQPGLNGSLTGVQAQDIETIRVLKDVADTSMYGMRGANGVIVITTKQAKR